MWAFWRITNLSTTVTRENHFFCSLILWAGNSNRAQWGWLAYFNLKYLFIYLFWLCWVFLAAHRPSLVAGSRGCSLVVTHCFSCCRAQAPGHTGFGHCSTWAQLPCSMWDLPGPRIEPMSPASAGRFLTTGPPGKVQDSSLLHDDIWDLSWKIQQLRTEMSRAHWQLPGGCCWLSWEVPKAVNTASSLSCGLCFLTRWW